MATHEHDVEAYPWEFGLFSGDSFSNPPYREGTSEPDLNHFRNICIREDEENTQASIFTQGLFEPYPCGYSLAIEGGQEEAGYIGPTSPGDSSYERVYSLDITNEFSKIDSEVGRRLNQMVSIPTACFDGLPLSNELSNKGINTKLGLTAEHVPRINGEIPSIDEATSDHQRLLDRLRVYDLVERKVEGDGNCQFRALSDQLYGTQDHHDFVRKKVINQLRSQREIYEGYIPMAYDDYLEKLSKNGEWGDHVTLQAAADAYGVKIFVITSFKDTCYIEILPRVQETKRVFFLSFWAEVHYNSIYPESDLPAGSTKKKKWWQFGK